MPNASVPDMRNRTAANESRVRKKDWLTIHEREGEESLEVAKKYLMWMNKEVRLRKERRGQFNAAANDSGERVRVYASAPECACSCVMRTRRSRREFLRVERLRLGGELGAYR
jgi:hypothetical protein